MATATKAPKPKLTLRDAVDLFAHVNRYIEEHIDEIELNGGALPDELVPLLDEIDAAMTDRVDALAAKIDEFSGYAESAKATKDRAARREKVWNNAIKSMKAYGALQVQRNGGEPLKGAAATLRLQRNGQPETIVALSDQQLLAIYDCEGVDRAEDRHPLEKFITVERVAHIDRKALAAAYEARRMELEAEAETHMARWVSVRDLPQHLIEATARELSPNAFTVADDVVVATARRLYASKHVADNLANEFPGVTVTRGCHLRID